MLVVVLVLFCLIVNCVCIGSPAYWGWVFNVELNFGLGLGWEPATTGSATDDYNDVLSICLVFVKL